MKKFTLDARKIPCPRPLLKTKEALAEGNFERIEVLVDNPAARENVMRFLNKAGLTEVSAEETETGTWLISADRTPLSPDTPEPAPLPRVSEPEADQLSGKTLLIGSDRIGRGNDELGTLLMKGFLYTLTELDTPPEVLIFMNAGVYLTCEGSENLQDLQKLETMGCRILVCGTCLEYLQMRDRHRIGTVSNMYEIAGLLVNNPHTVTLN